MLWIGLLCGIVVVHKVGKQVLEQLGAHGGGSGKGVTRLQSPQILSESGAQVKALQRAGQARQKVHGSTTLTRATWEEGAAGAGRGNMRARQGQRPTQLRNVWAWR